MNVQRSAIIFTALKVPATSRVVRRHSSTCIIQANFLEAIHGH